MINRIFPIFAIIIVTKTDFIKQIELWQEEIEEMTTILVGGVAKVNLMRITKSVWKIGTKQSIMIDL